MIIREDDLRKVLESINEAQALLRALLGGRTVRGAPVDMEFLDTKLDDLDFGRGLTVRARNVFRNNYVNKPPLITVRDLLAVTEPEMLRIPNVGWQTIRAIRRVLSQHGFDLGMTV